MFESWWTGETHFELLVDNKGPSLPELPPVPPDLTYHLLRRVPVSLGTLVKSEDLTLDDRRQARITGV